MSDSLQNQLASLHQLFLEAAPADPKTVSDYGWTVVKMLLAHASEVDSLTARQLLADCIQLPIERPSRLHSALLSAAIKVAAVSREFRFAAFLQMWGIDNLRPEDYERQTQDGKSFPSLAERAAKALGKSLLLYPQQAANASESIQLLAAHGLSIHPMIVTRIKEVQHPEGRKLIFVTLTSPEGLEVECISGALTPHPLRPLPEGKRHFVNIGQLYDCLLRQKPATVPDGSPSGQSSSSLSLKEAYLSDQSPITIFPTAIGYIEAIDATHGHMHVYDSDSRHFVAPVQRFSRERVGDFVRFIPIIPQASRFKTAIILATIPSSSEEVRHILRDIHINNINKEKGYAAWELLDKEHPITELLSPLQLSQGETSPAFTTGYLNLTDELSLSFSLSSSSSSYKALIYLKRGKDGQKRPHVARIFYDK